MSGKRSRDKGARGERLAAKILKDVTGANVERAARNGVGGAADLIGLPGFCVEVKYGYVAPRTSEWWDQAQAQASGKGHPLLMYKNKGAARWVLRFELRALKSMSHLSDAFWAEVDVGAFGEIYLNGEFVGHPWTSGT